MAGVQGHLQPCLQHRVNHILFLETSLILLLEGPTLHLEHSHWPALWQPHQSRPPLESERALYRAEVNVQERGRGEEKGRRLIVAITSPTQASRSRAAIGVLSNIDHQKKTKYRPNYLKYRPHSTISTKYRPQKFLIKRVFTLFTFKSWDKHILRKWGLLWNMRDKWGPFQLSTFTKALYMDHTALSRPYIPTIILGFWWNIDHFDVTSTKNSRISTI